MPRFKAEQFQSCGLHRFDAEASSLGLPPGRVPSSIEVDQLGNGRPFLLAKMDEEAFVFEQEFGCVTITIYND